MTGTPARAARTVAEHLARALALVEPLPVVDLPLDDAVGAVLAAAVVARVAVPPFDTVAMDGYALPLPPGVTSRTPPAARNEKDAGTAHG